MVGKVVMAAMTAAIFSACIAASTVRASDVGATVSASIEDQSLETRLSDYVSDLDGIYGVAAVNLEDGRTAFLNGGTPFPAASMYKLLVMYRVYQAIDRGELAMSDVISIWNSDVIQDEPDWGFGVGDTLTVGQALDAMITVSSNAAALSLMRQIGGPDVVESAAPELGMDATGTVDGDLWTTPNDMAHFFHLLADRELVSPGASESMISLLLGQTMNDRIPAPLPDWVAVAHKTGELDDTRNDGGIVDGENGRYVVVLMSRGGTPDDEILYEAELSRIVYRAYGK